MLSTYIKDDSHRFGFAWIIVWLTIAGVTGCGGQLRRVARTDLLSPPPAFLVQGPRPHFSEDYAGVVTVKDQWRLYSTLEPVQAVRDGDPSSVAITLPDHGSDQWLLVDLGDVSRFQAVRQIHGPGGGPPRRYRIDMAGPKGYPWKLAWVGEGTDGQSLAVFRRPVEARFFRITVLQEGEPRWAVAELEVF